MLITISSVGGAPGATSWALLLGAAWPARSVNGARPDRVVVEADPDGGALAARYGIAVDPGTASLVAACCRPDAPLQTDRHGRHIAGGLWVVPGPELPGPTAALWSAGAEATGRRLALDERVWLADIGRARPSSPVGDVIASAAINLIVVGPAIDSLVRVPARVDALAEHGPTCVLVVGTTRIRSGDLRRFLGGRAMWLVPSVADLPTATLRAVNGGRQRRSPLWRSAVAVAADVDAIARSEVSPVGTEERRPAPMADRADTSRAASVSRGHRSQPIAAPAPAGAELREARGAVMAPTLAEVASLRRPVGNRQAAEGPHPTHRHEQVGHQRRLA